jgi:hypothetical protein
LILVDILKAAGDSGLPIGEYRYVGMGANRFYDFLLIHRYLGITKMISLEHDEIFYERAKFNAPYSFINVKKISSTDFIATDEKEEKSIYWLDYDGGISRQIISDINDYAAGTKLGDFLFMTVSGNAPRVIDRENNVSRLVWLQDQLGAVAGEVTIEDVERATFPDAVHKVLWASFKTAFAARTDGVFFPLLQISYSDSMPMITFGGAFLAIGQALALKSKLTRHLPFLNLAECSKYEIRSLHLTDRERALFDIAVTSSNTRSSERNKLKKLGFRDAEINSYKDLLRYLPRYVETIV